ncbi:hypothetical protein L2E82_17091 [Cichorium intybus]|uniref:Uncharacterized protein n=1 Tax=Cichorium intybus TaxID=13427 RepID=A0ACB9F7B5_CICIN|nr:hypothetical protein L2E82_17091 [Cichorium intybus]
MLSLSSRRTRTITITEHLFYSFEDEEERYPSPSGPDFITERLKSKKKKKHSKRIGIYHHYITTVPLKINKTSRFPPPSYLTIDSFSLLCHHWFLNPSLLLQSATGDSSPTIPSSIRRRHLRLLQSTTSVCSFYHFSTTVDWSRIPQTFRYRLVKDSSKPSGIDLVRRKTDPDENHQNYLDGFTFQGLICPVISILVSSNAPQVFNKMSQRNFMENQILCHLRGLSLGYYRRGEIRS